ncbi:transporter [Bdellovibrio bacteriovorus]|uniref:Transporter n=1 Tax=Bdellovibrio bacteriovorus TaxID=959 RepID=A0A150WRX9_BDEBC|nr:DMT family transporter [Bdellovibrio bacteriovorus]KYG67077.1 transporter [Bdellovibrio bacteriovorus]
MLRSVLLLLLAMFSIQYGASLAKQLFPVLGAAGTTTLRVLFSAIVLTVMARPWKTKIPIKSWQVIALYGLSLGSMNLLFYMALQKIPLGIAVALEFVGPLGVSLYYSRKKIDLLWIGLALLGIIVLIPFDMTSAHALNLKGIALALAAGFFWGLYIIFGRKAAQAGPGLTVTAWGMWFAVLAVTPWGVSWDSEKISNISLWPVALAVALLSSTIPYALEMQALKKIPAKTFGVMMSMEPAIATLIGFIFLQEMLTGLQWVAVASVAIASAGSARSSQQNSK